MKISGDTINRPKATKHAGDTDNRPKAVKLSGDTINRHMATKHTGDTDNRPKAVKLSGDTDNLRNDAKYAVRPNGNPVGLFFHRVGDEKLAEARPRYGTLPPAWTGRGPCEREEVDRKYLGPKKSFLRFSLLPRSPRPLPIGCRAAARRQRLAVSKQTN